MFSDELNMRAIKSIGAKMRSYKRILQILQSIFLKS